MNNNNNLFKKYHNRLVWEGIIKAFILGLIAGFVAGLIFAFAALMANNFANLNNYETAVINMIIVSVIIWVAVTVAATTAFFFSFFRPKTKQIARRVDRLGLDERIVTMIELEKDESYVAMLQREDAKANLQKTKPKQLKLSIFLSPVIILAIVAVSTAGMITGSSLTHKNPLKWSNYNEVGSDVAKPGDEISVVYEITEGGLVFGETNQLIPFGGDASEVIAIADGGYVFSGWYNLRNLKMESDQPYRKDTNIRDKIYLIAVFDKLESSEGDGEGDNEGDQSRPGQPGEGSSDDAPKGDDKQKDPGDGAGGEFKEINTIIDGAEEYTENFEHYKAEAMRIIAEGGTVPSYLLALIDLYYMQLQPNK